MLKQVLIICGALCLCVGAAQADGAHIVSTLGMSPQQAKLLSRLEARAAAARRAWLASGHETRTAAPAITSGELLTPNLNVAKAPAAPEVSVDYQAAAGLSLISACFDSNMTTQTICSYYFVPFGLKGPTGGKVEIEEPYSNNTGDGVGAGISDGSLSLYAAPGDWSLSSLFIADISGAFVYYDQSQIATLFPGGSTINVTNSGTPDTSPPVILSGKVLTPVVKLSSPNPGFGAELTVSDNLSGIGQICVDVSAPNNTEYACDDNLPPSPQSRVVLAGTYIGKSAPTGAYTIADYSVCDVAGNCVFDSNSADIQSLFGTTTFTVTD